jgi:hypothetical protein
VIGVGAAGSLTSTSNVRFVVADRHPFMADRADVERWKQMFSLYFGEVQGAPSPGFLGLHPGQ